MTNETQDAVPTESDIEIARRRAMLAILNTLAETKYSAAATKDMAEAYAWLQHPRHAS